MFPTRSSQSLEVGSSMCRQLILPYFVKESATCEYDHRWGFLPAFSSPHPHKRGCSRVVAKVDIPFHTRKKLKLKSTSELGGQ